jgi:hypothetical protein
LAAGNSNCAWAKKTQEHPKIKKKKFEMVSTEISFGKTIGAPKTA